MKKVLIVLMMMCLGLAGTAVAKNGEVLYEWWDGIGGTNVGDLTGAAAYPDNPSGSTTITSFEVNDQGKSNFGGRLTGWLSPAQTGNYKFWVASDDSSELWLSTDNTPGNVVLVSQLTGWGGNDNFDDADVQDSVELGVGLVPLQAGKKYFIMGLYKEGGGGDHFSAAWQGDTAITSREIISGQYLASDPWGASKATNPSPGEGAAGIDPAAPITLSWDPPTIAPSGPVVEYDVYLSASPDIADPNAGDTPLGTVSAAGALELVIAGGTLTNDTTYYWRVDTIVDTGAPSTDPNNAVGDLWSFDTLKVKPVITGNPSDARVWKGDTASFAVTATSGENDDQGALTYQWYNSGGAIAGETSDTLAIANAQDADVDDYYCVVSNANGSTTSGSAALLIKHMLGWWKLDETEGGTAADSSTDSENLPGTVMQGTSVHPDPNSVWGEAGMIDGAFNGNGSNTWIDIGKYAADLGLDGNASKSVSAWTYTRAFNNGGIFDLGRRSGGQNWCLRTLGRDHRWRVQYWGGDWSYQTTNKWWSNDMNAIGEEDEFPSKNVWVHWVLAHDENYGTKVYADGRLIVDWAGKVLNTGDQMTFRIGQYGPNNQKFNGLIDDLRLYDFALDATEVALLYTDVVLDAMICVGGNPASDLNGDCIVNVEDLELFVGEWLECNLVPDCKP